MRALYETVIALTVKFEDIPRVAARERIELTKLAEGFWHITVHFGFVQIPDIPAALRRAKDRGCPVELKDPIYFGARHTVVCSERRNWFARIRLRLFMLMFRNSVRAVDRRQIEIYGPPKNTEQTWPRYHSFWPFACEAPGPDSPSRSASVKTTGMRSCSTSVWLSG
jgi:hypothetical protein